MRLVNPENMQRYNNVIAHLQEIAKTVPEVTLAITGEDDPYKDGMVYLMLPEAIRISKPVMHSIYSACFAADVCEMVATTQHRICFIVRDIYADGEEIPAAPSV